MSDLIERLQGIAGTSDHERGCAGREYSCSCGFDDLVEELCDKAQSTLRTQSATITTLQAELAEAREVPGRIVAWLQDEAVKDAGVRRRLHAEKKLTQLMTEAWDTLIQTKTGIATAIGARDWNKP